MALPRETAIENGRMLKFRYVNWREEEHTYLVIVEGVAYGAYSHSSGQQLAAADEEPEFNWVMHGYVLKRDGADRPGRRTFLLEKIELEKPKASRGLAGTVRDTAAAIGRKVGTE